MPALTKAALSRARDAQELAHTGVHFPDSDGQYVETPDVAQVDITGDIDILLRASADDWSTTSSFLLGKRSTAGGLAYQLGILNTGKLTFSFRSGGTDYFSPAVASSTSLSDGVTYWLRVTRAASTGAIDYYYAEDSYRVPSSWILINSASAASGALDANAAPLAINGFDSGVTERFKNWTVYRAIVKDGIDGTTVADYRALPVTNYLDSAGLTWTVNGSSVAWTL